MLIPLIEDAKKVARLKWHEYAKASRANRKDKTLDTLCKMYRQLKNGYKLVDIQVVLQQGGQHPDGSPKLAIAPYLNCKTVGLQCYSNGEFTYYPHEKNLFHTPKNRQVKVRFSKSMGYTTLKAPVPLVPPAHRPKLATENHFILWEVDKWVPEPPVDPYLLYRVTNRIFRVEAQWDLTEVERAAMRSLL